MQNRKYTITETIVGLLFMVAILWVGFYIFKGIFKILSFAAPVMFIAALIINKKVVLSFGKMLVALVQKNVVTGVIAILLTFLAFPFVSAFLLGMALLNKKADNLMTQARQEREGIPTDFKEISSAPKDKSGYDDIFNKS